MQNEEHKKQVSPKKLAANRQNAKRSPGPQTAKGKQRAAENSYKHGFYATRLFPNQEVLARDWADYKRILDGYWNHYMPVGDVEKLYVEKIAAESLRLTRLFGYEQAVFAWRAPFEARSVGNIVRYESNISRQLEKTIDRLERLQKARKEASNQSEFSDLESEDAISNPDEVTDEPSAPPEELIPEEPQDVSTSSKVPDASLTTPQPHVETSVKQGSAPTEMEPSSKPTETAASNPPQLENSVPGAGAQSLTKAVEQTMDPTSAEQHKGSLGSGEYHGIGRYFPRHLAESEEDEEMIERIKRGEDLNQIE
jgi:hypothetical protein